MGRKQVIIKILVLLLLISLLYIQLNQSWVPEYVNLNNYLKAAEFFLIGIIIIDFLSHIIKNREILDHLSIFSAVSVYIIIFLLLVAQKYLYFLLSFIVILILNYLIKRKVIKQKILLYSNVVVLIFFIYIASFFFQSSPCGLICGFKPMQKIENIYIYQIQNWLEPDGALQIYEREGKLPFLFPRNIGKIVINEGIKSVKRKDSEHIELVIDEGVKEKICILNTKTWNEKCKYQARMILLNL